MKKLIHSVEEKLKQKQRLFRLNTYGKLYASTKGILLVVGALFFMGNLQAQVQSFDLELDPDNIDYCLEDQITVVLTVENKSTSDYTVTYDIIQGGSVTSLSPVTNGTVTAMQVTSTPVELTETFTIPTGLSAGSYTIRATLTEVVTVPAGNGDASFQVSTSSFNVIVPELNTLLVDEAPGPFCPGDTIKVNFSERCIRPDWGFSAAGEGNIVVKLSDEMGDFTTPIDMEVLDMGVAEPDSMITGSSSDLRNLTIRAIIPDDGSLPSGDGYRVRVQTANGNFTTNLNDGGNTGDALEIKGLAITGEIVDVNGMSEVMPFPRESRVYCQGELLQLEFVSGDAVGPNNTYLVVLSDPDGSFGEDKVFADTAIIGTLQSTAQSGVIFARIPYYRTGSEDYKIRLVATDPGIAGCEYGPIIIPEIRTFLEPADDLECLGESVAFSSEPSITILDPASSGLDLTYDLDYQWEQACIDTFAICTEGLESISINDFVVDPDNPDIIYVATGEGIAVTFNGGVTFEPYENLKTGFTSEIFLYENGSGMKFLYAVQGEDLKVSSSDIAIPSNTFFFNINTGAGNISDIFVNQDGIWLATDQGLYLDTNPFGSGVTSAVYNGAVISVYVTGTFMAGGTAHIYMGTNSGLKVYRGGLALPFPLANIDEYDFLNTSNIYGLEGIKNNTILSIFIDEEERILYLGTANGVSISTDDGLSFFNVFEGLVDPQVFSVFADDGIVYASTPEGLGILNEGARRFTRYIREDGIGSEIVNHTFAFPAMDITGGTTRKLLIGAGSGLVKTNLSLTEIDASDPNLTVTGFGNVLFINDIDYDNVDCRYSLKVTATVNGGECVARSGLARVAQIPPNIFVDSIDLISVCDGENGQIIMTGLVPNTEYNLFYTYSVLDPMDTPDPPTDPQPPNGNQIVADSMGGFRLSGLSEGIYRIWVQSQENPPIPGCTSDTILQIMMDPPPPIDPELAIDPVTPVCIGDTVMISMTALTDMNDNFQWFNNADFTDPSNVILSSPANIIPTGTPNLFKINEKAAADGTVYVRAYNDSTKCFTENVLTVPYTVIPKPVIGVTKTNPGIVSMQDGETNGSIVLSGFEEDSTYTITWIGTPGPIAPGTFSFTADANAITNSPQSVDLVANNISFDETTGELTFGMLGKGVYSFQVTIDAGNAASCDADPINQCVLLDPSDFLPVDQPIVEEAFTVATECGTEGGYMQESNVSCVGGNLLFNDNNSGIAVGRIRDPNAIEPGTSGLGNVEMRGYVQFDLAAIIPDNAIIDRIEYQPVSINSRNETVCTTPVQSATGDIQFDVTQVDTLNYTDFPMNPYFAYDQETYDDFGETKYADFTIAKNSTGTWTDLGPQAVIDAQNQMAYGKKFQVGLRLSGNDFDLALYQFHGIVFDNATNHKIRITYHRLDYGDLPDSLYAVSGINGLEAPSHRIDSVDIDPLSGDANITLVTPMFIGANAPANDPVGIPDAELDGQSNPFATGDDLLGKDDENLAYNPTGIATPDNLDNVNSFINVTTGNELLAGDTVRMIIPITNNLPDIPANLSVFFDWNADGVFSNTGGERVDTTLGTGSFDVALTVNIPFDASNQEIGVRVRLTSGNVDAYGPAPNGEVEDLLVRVYQFDFGDLPDDGTPGTAQGDYPTIWDIDPAYDNTRGPRHLIREGLGIGTLLDSEGNGQPQASAFGDDINGIDDEDGIIPPDTIFRDEPAVFYVFVKNELGEDAFLNGFVDWNGDGDFEDEDEAGTPIIVGTSDQYAFAFNVPPMPVPLPDRVAARFRVSTVRDAVLLPTDPQPGPNEAFGKYDGEVEDIFVDIVGNDWGDLPEPRYITDAQGGFPGPSHKITYQIVGTGTDRDTINPLYIGMTPPDAERDGIPSANAMGDDEEFTDNANPENNLIDDEDLSEANFVFPNTSTSYAVIAGEAIDLQIPVRNTTGVTAYLWAFVDWNGDGDFDDEEEEKFLEVDSTDPLTTTMNTTYTFEYDPVPERNEPDTIGVRIRLTTSEIFDPYGRAPDGEVEDFLIELRGKEYGDLPDLTVNTGPNDFQTFRENDGPGHGVQVIPLTYMGEHIDTEADGVPNADATGDDRNRIINDEDGIVFLTPLVPGQTAQIAFSGINDLLAPGNAELYMFIDWENDGELEYVPFNVGSNPILVPGDTVLKEDPRILTFDVDPNATFEEGNAYFRFRLTTDAEIRDVNNIPQPNGIAVDGEVEDYLVPVFKMGNLVWEDRNNNGFQDPEEIGLGIPGVRVVLRFGGIRFSGECDTINQTTIKAPATVELDANNPADMMQDSVLITFTDENGLYCFDGLIEGYYQVIAVDTFDLTPTRPDWIDNVTEEDRDSDGIPFKEPWDYEDDPGDPMPLDIRQSKSQVFKLTRDSIGTDEEGILDQRNPGLTDPNGLAGYPDKRLEQRIDFGYTAFDFGDLRGEGDDLFVTEENETITNSNDVAGLFPLDTVLVGNPTEGPKHIVTPNVYLGECADAETEGQPDYDAGAEFALEPQVDYCENGPGPNPDGLGDDPNDSGWNTTDRQDTLNCVDDENGIKFMTPLVPGYEAIIDLKFFATINDDGPDAFLQAFFDWNGDNDFYIDGDPTNGFDPNEHIIFTHLNGDTLLLEPNTLAVELEMSEYIDNDSIRLMFNVPADAKMNDGNILTRFRIGKDPNMGATGILPGNLNFPDGIVPEGEVEDYFMKLSKVGNIVWEDRDYDGIQDEDEPGIAGVKITLDFFGIDGELNGDFFEKQYETVTDKDGKYYFCGLIGNVDPSGIENPSYRLTADDPDNMTPTVNRDQEDCITYNSDGNDDDIDDRITAIDFTIENPMALCTGEEDPVGKLDMTQILIMDLGGGLADNVWPDCQIDETLDFGYVGFDYGDLPDTSSTDTDEYNYITQRDWLPTDPQNNMGPRHAIQPKLYLGNGVDGELNGQPDLDAGSKAGGDDDFAGEDPIRFYQGTEEDDDESGIRLLTPLLPGEYAYIRVNYTAQDTTLNDVDGTDDGYVNLDAFLNAFVDWNGDGDFYPNGDITDPSFDPGEKIVFTHQGDDPENLDALAVPTDNPILPGGVDTFQILGFRVPDTSITDFNEGRAFMRFRLSFEGDLDPDNHRYHKTDPPHVVLDPEPAADPNNQVEALTWVWDPVEFTYPRGEVEDYAVPLAKIGNLAWYDHNVNGRQDPADALGALYNTYVDEYGVDTLHLVLIWGGVDDETGAFDTVGYQGTDMMSLGAVTDIRYNLSIAPQLELPSGDGTYDPDDIIKTTIDGLYSFRGLIPGTYNLIPLKYLQEDSTDFVNFWPKHRVLTVKNNEEMSDSLDSDAGPGAVFTINDINTAKDPEVCVGDLPTGEDGQLDMTLDLNDPFFPDTLYDQTIDFGWVDEPNIEANLDLVGVDFPTSEICGHFNVIYHLCLKNPTETPLDSIVPFLNIAKGYGAGFYSATKPEVSIIEQSYLSGKEAAEKGLDYCEPHRKAQSGSVDSLSRYINGGYDGLNDTLLLTGGDSESGYFLPGDSVICIRIEFEVNPEFYNPTPQNPCPWMLRGGSYARAVGFEYDADQSEPWLGGAKKTRLIDWRTKNDPAGTINPRFGHHIQVYDLSDEYDDNAYRAIGGKRVADHIRFEGFVMDRGDRGEYKVFELKSLTGRDKYLDEDDYTVQDDECWEKTKNLSGVDNVFATLDENCEIKLIPEMFITNYDKDCGFGAYPEGSYYRVIIQDEHTGETLWSSADRVPFDGSKYFGRKLIYKARSVANFCEVIWGRLTLEDKLAPVVECLPDTDKPLLYPGRFVCSDIDSILNVSASWEDDEYRYYTGVASATDNCGEAILERVSDVVRYFNDCVEGGNQLYAYPYAIITRTFLFKDDYGNESLCMQEIYIHRPEIYLPECKVFLNAKEVGSDETLSLADLVNTYEQELSVPFYKNAVGDTIYLSEANACGFGITYEDVGPFQKGDCGFKLERKWAIVDWCYGQGGSDYPDYFIEPEEDGDCYQSGGYNGNVYEFTQLLEVGDKLAPIVGIPDLDRDGFAGVNGYQDGPIADPELSTGSYDAEDVFEYPTGTDCAADFIVNKELFNVKEHGNWCFDVDVVVRQPVLDFDERPKPGEFEFVNDPGIRISGDCESGYWVSDAPMVLDTTKYYFLEGYFYDDCNNDTTVYIPFVVVDSTPPVMICDDAIRVTYDNLGRGSLAAVDVDEGTTDNCNKILWLKVRRPVLDCEDSFQSLPEYVDENNNNIIDRGDWIDENGNNRRDTLEYFVKVLADNGVDSILMSPLLDEVPFFCCDPDSVKVELWASDKSGNRSNCWQYALLENRPPIQYELPGNYILPDNAQYNCEEEEDKVVLLTSGGIYSQGSLTYRAAVDLLGGDLFIVQDNTCSGFIQEMEVLPTLDQCGFGYIDVRWILTTGAPLPEPHNEESVITEWRRIRIVEKHDYWIKFPKDVYTNCTSPSPDTIEVSSDACDLMAIARLPDERFSTPQDPDVCYKIFRTYRVINWCEYDGQQDPVVVSRDWDRWNGSDLGTFTLNDDGDFDNVREYNLNPRNPEGDDIPGNTDLYVIVQRDFNDGRVDRVYYDADPDPTEDLQIQFYGDGSPVSTEHPNFIPGTGTRDLAGQDAETYWWQVTSGGFERRRSNGTTYYEGYGPSDERYYEGTYRQSWDQPNSGGSSVRPSSPERYLPVMWANDGNANNADPNGSTNGSGDNDDNDYSYGSVGFWQYTQHILVYDEEDPELTVDLADTYPSLSNVDCAGEVVVPINALDLCNGDTTNVLIRVIVDGEDVSSQYDAGSGVYSDRLGLGKHDLIVTARDACGNVATFRDEIEVVDGKGPSPIIRNDLVIELGRDEADSTGGGSATIWADDFVLSPIYDCTGQDGSEVDENGNARVTEYSINLVGDSAQIDQKGLSFDCEDVGALIEVEIHAWDGAGNHDYAVTTVIVQDNLGACDQEAGAGSIAGAIATQDDNRVNEVEVRLSGADQRMYMTNATGTYAFTELVEDSDYTVIPEKNDFHNNGISTFDVILMQKHILGTGLLESPYDQIAADINRSGTITTLDLIQLRKMILAIDTEFADNTSWRFVDADYVFSNNPLTDAFPEVKNINNLLGAEEANFIAIKIGDLNGSAAAYVQPRSQTERLSLEARMSEAHLEAGREYRIGIRTKDESLVQGYQFSLELKEVAIVDVIYGQLQEEHVGMFSKEGILTVSWNGEGVGEELMSIIVRPSTGLAAQDVIRLSSTKTEVEAYNDRDEIMGIDLSIGIDEGMRLSNELYQNVPNPFKGETQIGFRLGEASRAVLKIRDVQGRLIKQIEGEYGIGEHQIRLKEEELPSAGVYYYSLEAGDYTATKKLILIDSASR